MFLENGPTSHLATVVFSRFIFRIYDMGIQGVTRGYRGLQGDTRGDRELQGVTKDYRNFFV